MFASVVDFSEALSIALIGLSHQVGEDYSFDQSLFSPIFKIIEFERD